MRKTDKKIDNQLRRVLTDVCEVALKEIKGFQWLTHGVDYSRFPQSLRVVCVFDSDENLATFMTLGGQQSLASLIQKKLTGAGVNINNISAQISYDTEQKCQMTHNGKWTERLKYLTVWNTDTFERLMPQASVTVSNL